jgi:hypothetical protein
MKFRSQMMMRITLTHPQKEKTQMKNNKRKIHNKITNNTWINTALAYAGTD